jgi:hypothetical protein
MQAKVTKEFRGRPDGEPLVRTIGVDEIIEGDLAVVAVREKWAKEIDLKAVDRAAKKRAEAEKSVTDARAALDLWKTATAAAEADQKGDAEKAEAAAAEALKVAEDALAKLG